MNNDELDAAAAAFEEPINEEEWKLIDHPPLPWTNLGRDPKAGEEAHC